MNDCEIKKIFCYFKAVLFRKLFSDTYVSLELEALLVFIYKVSK